MPALRLHLGDAYGWFLLSVSGVEDASPGMRPRSVADLPAPEPGRARPPELAEFSQLEADGWLADMLAGDASEHTRPGGAATLLGSDRSAPDYALAARWVQALEAIMARMDDSLAEC